MNHTPYPSRWFNHEDGDKLPAIRRRGENSRDAFHSEVDRMFDEFFTAMKYGGIPSLFGGAGRGNILLKPNLDLAASGKEYSVTVELPGVHENDIAIEANRDTLTISGEKKRECNAKDEKGVYRAERSYGSFHRTLALPEDTNIDGITASFDKGVLLVTIPRVQTKNTKTIPITKG